MKRKTCLSLAVALLGLVGWTGYAQGQRGSSRGPSWEYRVLRAPTFPNSNMISSEDAQRVLSQQGADGWELVTVAGGDFYLKRTR